MGFDELVREDVLNQAGLTESDITNDDFLRDAIWNLLRGDSADYYTQDDQKVVIKTINDLIEDLKLSK